MNYSNFPDTRDKADPSRVDQSSLIWRTVLVLILNRQTASLRANSCRSQQ